MLSARFTEWGGPHYREAMDPQKATVHLSSSRKRHTKEQGEKRGGQIRVPRVGRERDIKRYILKYMSMSMNHHKGEGKKQQFKSFTTQTHTRLHQNNNNNNSKINSSQKRNGSPRRRFTTPFFHTHKKKIIYGPSSGCVPFFWSIPCRTAFHCCARLGRASGRSAEWS